MAHNSFKCWVYSKNNYTQLTLFLKSYFEFCVCLCACEYMLCVCMYPQRLEEGTGSPWSYSHRWFVSCPAWALETTLRTSRRVSRAKPPFYPLSFRVSAHVCTRACVCVCTCMGIRIHGGQGQLCGTVLFPPFCELWDWTLLARPCDKCQPQFHLASP